MLEVPFCFKSFSKLCPADYELKVTEAEGAYNKDVEKYQGIFSPFCSFWLFFYFIVLIKSVSWNLTEIQFTNALDLGMV